MSGTADPSSMKAALSELTAAMSQLWGMIPAEGNARFEILRNFFESGLRPLPGVA